MVDVSLFTDRVFSGGIIAVVMWGFGLFGIYFFTSLYLQNVLGFSPDRGRRGVRADGAADGGRRGRSPSGWPPPSARTARSRLAMLLMAARHRLGEPARRATRRSST